MPKDDPQVEEGFTRLANTWLEALLAFPATPAVKLLVIAVARLTWGWNRTWRVIPQAELSDLLGYSRQRLNRIQTEAKEANLIVTRRKGRHLEYRVQKRPTMWVRPVNTPFTNDVFTPPVNTPFTNDVFTSSVNTPFTGQPSIPNNDVLKTPGKTHVLKERGVKGVCFSEKLEQGNGTPKRLVPKAVEELPVYPPNELGIRQLLLEQLSNTSQHGRKAHICLRFMEMVNDPDSLVTAELIIEELLLNPFQKRYHALEWCEEIIADVAKHAQFLESEAMNELRKQHTRELLAPVPDPPPGGYKTLPKKEKAHVSNRTIQSRVQTSGVQGDEGETSEPPGRGVERLDGAYGRAVSEMAAPSGERPRGTESADGSSGGNAGGSGDGDKTEERTDSKGGEH